MHVRRLKFHSHQASTSDGDSEVIKFMHASNESNETNVTRDNDIIHYHEFRDELLVLDSIIQ